MGLPEFAREMKVPVNYRDSVISNAALAWVFYERRSQLGELKPVVRIGRRKELKKKRKNSLDIAGGVLDIHRSRIVVSHAGSACRPLFADYFLSLLGGMIRLIPFVIHSTRTRNQLRSS